MNKIYSINGPVVKVRNTNEFSMLEMVYVGNKRLIGEVISIDDEFTTIQVYEVTTGMKIGEPVYTTGAPMCAVLGPGIISNIFDGIERPLMEIKRLSGAFINEGADVSPIDTNRFYDVTIEAKRGDMISGGMIYASCPRNSLDKALLYAFSAPFRKGCLDG